MLTRDSQNDVIRGGVIRITSEAVMGGHGAHAQGQGHGSRARGGGHATSIDIAAVSVC